MISLFLPYVLQGQLHVGWVRHLPDWQPPSLVCQDPGRREPAPAAGWGILVLAVDSPPKGTRVPGCRAAIQQARVPEELIWGTIQTFGQAPAPLHATR